MIASMKKLGMSFLTTSSSKIVVFPLSRRDLWRQIDTIGRAEEQQHGATDLVGIDLQFDLFAGRIFALVGDQFQVVEAEAGAANALPRTVNM